MSQTSDPTQPQAAPAPGDLTTFAKRAIGRKRVFGVLSMVGVAVGLGLALTFALTHQPGDPIGLQAVVVVLILLNARGNLRQVRYVNALEALTTPQGVDDE